MITSFDCRVHRKLAHQSILEWTLAMSSLKLPPYVLEAIFDALKLNPAEADYQQRVGIDFLWIPPVSDNVNANFIHLILEERSHSENIKLFISVQKAMK